MEVGVRIEAEDLKTGRITHTGSSYLTYVAIDENGRPVEIPDVVPETPEEKIRWREGKQRRAERLKILQDRKRKSKA
jgi:acyl-CoA hydrolase